jgi:phosphohistidine phosphatase SixA
MWYLALLIATVIAVAPVRAEPLGLKSADLIELLRRPGHVTLMRHALAPFDGAPRESGKLPHELGPCETQRNLDDNGRADARRVGAVFRAAGVSFEKIYTSKWCRCRETADLIAGRPVENLPLIDSYFTSPDKAVRQPSQLAALKHFVNFILLPTDRALLVTHGSLIQDLTGVFTDEAETVIVKADGKGGIVVLARGIP